MSNMTNGAITDYQVQIKPSSTVFTDDTFEIKFPPEVVLEETIECLRDVDSYILELDCIRYADQRVKFRFVEVDSVTAAN